MLSQPIRIAIIGEQGLYQDALVESLAGQLDFRVAGSFSSLEQASPAIQAVGIDLLLFATDYGGQPAEAINRVRALGFAGDLLIIAAGTGKHGPGAQSNTRAIVVFQSDPLSLLCRKIRETSNRRHSGRAILSFAAESRKTTLPRLTPREIDVLGGVFKGRSNKEIAAGLGISENTVKTYVQQLFSKTGTCSRSQLVRMALERSGSVVKAEPEKPVSLVMVAEVR
jgi:DNA-binding NarL/FixJ family response regulator